MIDVTIIVYLQIFRKSLQTILLILLNRLMFSWVDQGKPFSVQSNRNIFRNPNPGVHIFHTKTTNESPRAQILKRKRCMFINIPSGSIFCVYISRRPKTSIRSEYLLLVLIEEIVAPTKANRREVAKNSKLIVCLCVGRCSQREGTVQHSTPIRRDPIQTSIVWKYTRC